VKLPFGDVMNQRTDFNDFLILCFPGTYLASQPPDIR